MVSCVAGFSVVGLIMPRFVIKVEKHGRQVRVTIPKLMADELGLRRIAYALAHIQDGESIIITPFIDEGMLDEAISGSGGKKDPGTERPGST